MSPKTLGRVLRVALCALAIGPAWARAPSGSGHDLRPSRSSPQQARMPILPPDVRYRDPRHYPPVRRPAAPPAALIPAYLPRHTDLPMYNEPPDRFSRW